MLTTQGTCDGRVQVQFIDALHQNLHSIHYSRKANISKYVIQMSVPMQLRCMKPITESLALLGDKTSKIRSYWRVWHEKGKIYQFVFEIAWNNVEH